MWVQPARGGISFQGSAWKSLARPMPIGFQNGFLEDHFSFALDASAMNQIENTRRRSQPTCPLNRRMRRSRIRRAHTTPTTADRRGSKPSRARGVGRPDPRPTVQRLTGHPRDCRRSDSHTRPSSGPTVRAARVRFAGAQNRPARSRWDPASAQRPGRGLKATGTPTGPPQRQGPAV